MIANKLIVVILVFNSESRAKFFFLVDFGFSFYRFLEFCEATQNFLSTSNYKM